MMKSLIVAAGLMAAALCSTSASALPLAGSAPSAAPEESLVVQIHNGFHRSCELGVRGWHYNTPRDGRVDCRPRRPIGFGWGWREEGGRRGWYQERNRRWDERRSGSWR
jgi:hypothetical protein